MNASVIVRTLAAVVTLVCVCASVREISERLSHPKPAEDTGGWREAARRAAAEEELGVLCADAAAVDSVERARLIAVAWERMPRPPRAVDVRTGLGGATQVVASSFLSAERRLSLEVLGYAPGFSNEFATVWRRTDLPAAKGPARTADVPPAGREAAGAAAVTLLLLGLLAWRLPPVRRPGALAVSAAALAFAAGTAVTLSHGLVAPNGLGVFAGKARLAVLAGGIPEGFWTAPEFAVLQPSYPPGLFALTVLAYAVAGGCGEWLVQLLVPAASGALALTVAAHRRHRTAFVAAALLTLSPLVLRMDSGYYAEPFAALALAAGWRAVRARGASADWFVMGLAALFRHEALILVGCLWLGTRLTFGATPATRRGLVAALAPGLGWELFTLAVGARVYDFDFGAWPSLTRAGSAAVAVLRSGCWAFAATGGVLALGLTAAAVSRRRGLRAALFAAGAFLAVSAALFGFNTSVHFDWVVRFTVPRLVFLASAAVACELAAAPFPSRAGGSRASGAP